MRKTKLLTISNLLAIITWITLPSPGFSQGSLTPPGPPGPMMKTLQQIEPRTPISSLPFTISAPGSYYITTNLSVSSAVDGITVAANDVTLDLNGFVLTGTGGTRSAVYASGQWFNLVVRNGTIRNWGSGVNLAAAGNSRCENLQVFGNANGPGIQLADNCLVADCLASGNLLGIVVNDGGIVKGCTACGNSNGITGGSGVSLTGCVALSNAAWGLIVSTNSSVQNCVSSKNSQSTSGGGILTAHNCKVIGCTANDNRWLMGSPPTVHGMGILALTQCVIRDCTVNGQYTAIAAADFSIVLDCSASAIGIQNNGIAVANSCVVRGCVVSAAYALQANSYCIIEDNISYTVYPSPTLYGSNNIVVHNSLIGAGIGTLGSPNTIGTSDNSTTLNTDKNPHANFTP